MKSKIKYDKVVLYILLNFFVENDGYKRYNISKYSYGEVILGMEFIRCPKCGKINRYIGSYCKECFEDYDNMNITENDFVIPIYEKKFIYLTDEKYYEKVIMFSEKEGVMISPSIWDDDYQEDDICRYIVKRGKVISIIDDNFGTEYEKKYEIGDWYLRSLAKIDDYKGNIPYGNYFEVFCETVTIANLDVWFTNKGDMFMYNPEVRSVEDLRPIKKGRYVREDDIIRYEIKDIKTGKTIRSYACVINGKYCPGTYVCEEKYSQLKSIVNKPISVANPLVAPATISEQEFFDNYPCLICNTRQAWIKKEWSYYANGEISMYAECKLCGHVAQETEKADTMKRIAYNGSRPIQGYRPPAGSVRYLDNPCPYCNSYQVRYIKWKDKRASVYFWGRLSMKIGTHYICDNCKKTWE